MLHRFRQWLFPRPPHNQALDQERSQRLTTENELQSLRLELDQARQQLAQVEAERQRRSQEEANSLRDHLDTQLVALLTPLATPLAQLLTQRHLIERQGKELTPKDLLATSHRLWQEFSVVGVEALETIGAEVPFDPDRHQPLNQSSRVRRGETVGVRMPGIQLKGRVIKTAAVVPLAGR